MRVAEGSGISFVERTNKPRAGLFLQRKLMEGQPGTAGNYLLQNAETRGDFASPRHKHNFDQVRFQIRGTFDFGRDGTMSPGVVGYFPEGTPYGPQTSSEDSLTLVLQCGGRSGSGYMSEAELSESVAALRAFGEFKGGVFTRTGENGGRKNQDAYEACWEYHNKRELTYPPVRFQTPILMNPEHFAWIESPGEAGVARRVLGSFGEGGSDVGFVKLDPGADHVVSGARLFYVLSGHGTLENQTWKPETTIELRTGETATLHAHSASEILFMGLPTAQ